MSETPEPVGTEAPKATGLTLETYAPHPLVETAIECAAHQISEAGKLGAAFAVRATPHIMTVASAVVLADLVAQGVAPYAEAPGMASEDSPEATGAIVDWVGKRVSAELMGNLLRSLRRGGRGESLIAFLMER